MRPRTLVLTGIFCMLCGLLLASFFKQKFAGDIIGTVGIACLIFGIVRSMGSQTEEP